MVGNIRCDLFLNVRVFRWLLLGHAHLMGHACFSWQYLLFLSIFLFNRPHVQSILSVHRSTIDRIVFIYVHIACLLLLLLLDAILMVNVVLNGSPLLLRLLCTGHSTSRIVAHSTPNACWIWCLVAITWICATWAIKCLVIFHYKWQSANKWPILLRYNNNKCCYLFVSSFSRDCFELMR